MGAPPRSSSRSASLRQGADWGVAKGRFEVPEDIDAHNDEVAQLFGAGRAL